jgi:hypothetical protein
MDKKNNTGYCNTGDRNTGDWNAGNFNTGYCNTGYCNTGDRNTGDRNTGDRNTGHWNTGDWNTGDWNAGYCNTGYCNTGDRNTGDRNTGDRNTGDRNTGHWNTGDWNTGDWNTVDKETGFFNTIQRKTIRVFNKECDIEVWDKANKPHWLYFNLTEWVPESDMTDKEKEEHPEYKTTEGYLKKYDYKEAFQKSYNSASRKNQLKVKDLPNFDADVFFEISGIRVDDESDNDIITIDGVKYKKVVEKR